MPLAGASGSFLPPLMSFNHVERSKKASLMFGNRHCVWMLVSMEIYTQAYFPALRGCPQGVCQRHMTRKFLTTSQTLGPEAQTCLHKAPQLKQSGTCYV